MKDTSPLNEAFVLPEETNFVSQGEGAPVVMIHGLAASLHDWDDLIPELVQRGYAAYALDLLGHGDSPKPDSRAYRMDWLFDHFAAWLDSLGLDQPPVLVGHSLGGYLALEYARRHPARTRSLVLVDPFYRLEQLPSLVRFSYRRPRLNLAMVERAPEWLLRIMIDATSLSMGHSNGGAHNLPARVRAQTALDYKRTAAGVYNLPNTVVDLTDYLPQIELPSLILWGERDTTLAPASFTDLASALPCVTARTLPSGHVPHQSHAAQFNALVIGFLDSLRR
jgi:pimeloyl-ACP methyl ester carboxylesterase